MAKMDAMQVIQAKLDAFEKIEALVASLRPKRGRKAAAVEAAAPKKAKPLKKKAKPPKRQQVEDELPESDDFE